MGTHRGRRKYEVSSYRVPEADLPLAHPGKACSEDVTLFGEDGSHGPDAFMWCQSLLQRQELISERRL